MGFLKFMNKEYMSAVQDFDELRKKYLDNENFEEAGIYQGKCYLELKKYKQAQAVFGQMVDKGSKRAEATLWLAETFIRREKFKMALEILKPALSTFAKDNLLPELTFKYANALMGMKQYKEAAKYFKKTAEDFKEFSLTPDALRLESLCENKAGRYSPSFDVCNEFLKKYPQNPSAEDVGFLKADNLFFLKKYDDAIKEYRQFVPWDGIGKYTNYAVFRIVQSLCELKRWDEALTEAKPLMLRKVTGPFFEQLYYMTGLCCYNLENWEAAIRNFDKFLADFSNAENADAALMKKATAYLMLKMPKDAESSFLQVIKSHPKSLFFPQALVETGKIYFEKKDFGKASELLNQVLDKYSSSKFVPQAEYYLAWIAMDQEQNDKALELFQSVAEKFPNTPFAPDALYQQGILLLKQKDYDAAKEKFDKFLSSYSSSPKAEMVRFYQAVAISKGGKNGNAEAMFKKFIAEHPKSDMIPRALYESAWLARENKKINQARDDYKALISEFPSSELTERAIFELAELEYEAKKYDDSLALLDKLLAKGVSEKLQQKILYREAWCFLGRKQEDEALEAFERLLKNWPNTEFTSVAAYQAGEIRLKKKDFTSAYELFKQSVMAGGEGEVREQALLRLGEAQTLRDNWSGAKKTFETFMAEFPKSSFMRRARFWRGWCNENLKEYKNAITDYSAVLRYNIKDEISARAQFQMGEAYMELKEYDKALKALVKVEINYGKFADWVARAKLEMGQILDKQGKKDLAVEQYKKLVSKYPKSEEAGLARELLLQHQVYIDK
jgi:TolA-binding protein